MLFIKAAGACFCRCFPLANAMLKIEPPFLVQSLRVLLSRMHLLSFCLSVHFTTGPSYLYSTRRRTLK